jgi:hypothetical protein
VKAADANKLTPEAVSEAFSLRVGELKSDKEMSGIDKARLLDKFGSDQKLLTLVIQHMPQLIAAAAAEIAVDKARQKPESRNPIVYIFKKAKSFAARILPSRGNRTEATLSVSAAPQA